MFQLRPAERKQVKMRLGLSGASGFGKTYSALFMAFGLCGDWSKIALIDTENNSGDMYEDLGKYNVVPFPAPYSPERYIEAIEACEKAGMEVTIIDSISHEWEGKGGCLEIVDKLGGRYQDWSKVTPRHQAFVSKVLSSPCHIITTVRRKQDYDMVKDGNKTTVVKVGMKEVTREGWEYELTVNLEIINDAHMVRASKDRTGLFSGQPEFVITSETGNKILEWCNSGRAVDLTEIFAALSTCNTQEEVKILYGNYPEQKGNAAFRELFVKRGEELESTQSKVDTETGEIFPAKDVDESKTVLEKEVNEQFEREVQKRLKPLKEDMREAAGN